MSHLLDKAFDRIDHNWDTFSRMCKAAAEALAAAKVVRKKEEAEGGGSCLVLAVTFLRKAEGIGLAEAKGYVDLVIKVERGFKDGKFVGQVKGMDYLR